MKLKKRDCANSPETLVQADCTRPFNKYRDYNTILTIKSMESVFVLCLQIGGFFYGGK